ncbi:hypothetical protein CMO89_04315 [Candidatus Woesearchaeota archaeon]|nr:hypothetical protein [Candidatus Woesearchaeota archaeon]|tara:strand:+ start:6566 stop:7120 length:555 start_codon:yes stop_codon:yes gene_type:complete
MPKKKEIRKLNIRCNNERLDGFWNIDSIKGEAVDEVVDFGKPLPYPGNSIEHINCFHALEYIEDFGHIMKEIHRVCKNNAVVDIKVCHFTSAPAYNPFHRNFFNSSTFGIYDKSLSWPTRLRSRMKVELRVLENKLVFNKGFNPLNYLGPVFNLSNGLKFFYENSFLRNLIPAREVHFILKVVK